MRNPHSEMCECADCDFDRAVKVAAFDADLYSTDPTGQAVRLRQMIEVEPAVCVVSPR